MARPKTIYKKGEIICREGQFELWMFEIQEGSVGIYKNYGEPDQKKLAVVSEGFVGEMGVIDTMARSATVVAEERSKIIKISSKEFVSYMKENPQKIQTMMKCLANRLKEINEEYLEACNTIREYLKINEENGEKSEGLAAAMKKFSKIFRKRTAVIAAALVIASAGAAVAPSINVTANDGRGVYAVENGSIREIDVMKYVQPALGCNVRESGSTNSRIVNSFPCGAYVHVDGILCSNGVDTGWRRVLVQDQTYGGWTSGYIRADLLGDTKPSGGSGNGGGSGSGINTNKNATGKHCYQVRVNTGYLALRNARAYDDSNIIGRLYNGDMVWVEDGNYGTYWYVYANGMSGWVNSNYLVCIE